MSDSAALDDNLPPRAAATVVMLGLLACGLPVSLAACGKAHRAGPIPAGDQTADAAPKSLAMAVAESPPPPRGKQITIAYSSNLLGEYEPCG
jgi:hypothetical protein